MVLTTVFLVLFLDQITKFLAVRNLTLHESVPVLKGIISMTLVYNRGAAFGIFKDRFHLFVFISVVTIILIYFILQKNKGNKWFSFSLSLILGGAFGNLIDRIFSGHVIDFLDFHIWPVFNIADSAITLGTIILGWLVFRPVRKNAT